MPLLGPPEWLSDEELKLWRVRRERLVEDFRLQLKAKGLSVKKKAELALALELWEADLRAYQVTRDRRG